MIHLKSDNKTASKIIQIFILLLHDFSQDVKEVFISRLSELVKMSNIDPER